ADDAPARADRARGEEGVDPGARAEVEDGLAGPKIEAGDRRAATEPEVGLGGHRGELVGAVADAERQRGRGRFRVRRTGAAAAGLLTGGDPAVALAHLRDQRFGFDGEGAHEG